MEEIKTYKLEDISVGKGCYGIAASAIPYSHNKRTYLRITDINDDGSINLSGLMSVEDENADKFLLNPNDIVFARTGNSTGRSYFYDGSVGPLVYAGFLIKFSLDKTKVNPRILKYYTHSQKYYDWVHSFDTGGTRGNINAKTYGEMPIDLPSIETQNRIVSILKSLDDKIELNKRINDNLEQQAQALFKSWFVDFEPFKDGKFVDSELGMIPEGWKVCAASDIFDINIGKTPPRKEQEWFSTEKNQNVTWVSISDMGNNGMFISDSSEYLTKEAVSKFNIIIVPNNTILLSFKLTIGRVAICNSELTTNEAIARFYLPNDSFREYLYLALKDYDYTKLGSTSSIATAVNSKIIKNMLMLSPGNKVIQKFSSLVNPLFETIKLHQDEICNLSLERDTLLPKLMSGELKINDLNN